jgi:hypothetical protein
MEENVEAKDKDDGLPDSENCRAKGFSSSDYELVNCLVEHPLCNFALHFGSGLLCRHPRRKEIVERTKAMLDDSAKSA